MDKNSASALWKIWLSGRIQSVKEHSQGVFFSFFVHQQLSPKASVFNMFLTIPSNPLSGEKDAKRENKDIRHNESEDQERKRKTNHREVCTSPLLSD